MLHVPVHIFVPNGEANLNGLVIAWPDGYQPPTGVSLASLRVVWEPRPTGELPLVYDGERRLVTTPVGTAGVEGGTVWEVWVKIDDPEPPKVPPGPLGPTPATDQNG